MFIKKSKTVKDSIYTLGANLISQAMSFMIVVLVSNVLSVTKYGLYCVLNSMSSFVSDMSDMGMNGAITRFVAEYRSKEDRDNEEAIILYAIKRKIINLAIVFVLLVLFARPIAAYWLHDEKKYYYVYIVIISCAFSLFVGALRAVLQGRQEFKKYFFTVVAWNIIWCICIVLITLAGKLDVISSILSGAISGMINIIISIKLVDFPKKKIIVKPEIKNKFNNFGNWMLLWSLFAILQSKLDVFMLASLTTAEEISFYDIATKIMKPILMVVSAYSQVLNPQFASIDESKIKEKIISVAKFIAAITGMIIAAIFLVKPLITIVFGHKYDNAILPARLLLIAIIFFVWTVPFNSALYALNKPHIFAFASFAGLIVTAVGNVILLEEYGAVGAAVTFVFAQIAGLIISVFAYQRIKKENNT